MRGSTICPCTLVWLLDTFFCMLDGGEKVSFSSHRQQAYKITGNTFPARMYFHEPLASECKYL